MSNGKTALILGATGGAGYETARALLRRGWRIRALHRRPEVAQVLLPEAEWVRGDAMRASDVAAAAQGAHAIFHGVNPPGYRDWPRLAPAMLESTIAAARAEGARILFPGAIYNFGPDAYPLLKEDSPQNPGFRKGRIRVAMEKRLEEASAQGAPVLILRAGDFFGPHSTGNSWFASCLVQPGRPVRRIMYPGPMEIGHAWAYLPDYGETFARLLDCEEELGAFERFHFEGCWLERGGAFAERLREVVGDPSIPIRRLPWRLIGALSPFVRLFREMMEVRGLWTTPIRLDNSRLVGFLGEEPRTPLDEALRRSWIGQGCAPAGDRAEAGPLQSSARAL